MQWQDSAFVLWVIMVSAVKKVLVLWWERKKKKGKKGENRKQKAELKKLHIITEIFVGSLFFPILSLMNILKHWIWDRFPVIQLGVPIPL